MILFRCTSNYGTIRKDSDLFGTVFYKSNGVHLFDANTLFTLQCQLFRLFVLLSSCNKSRIWKYIWGKIELFGSHIGCFICFYYTWCNSGWGCLLSNKVSLKLMLCGLCKKRYSLLSYVISYWENSLKNLLLVLTKK